MKRFILLGFVTGSLLVAFATFAQFAEAPYYDAVTFSFRKRCTDEGMESCVRFLMKDQDKRTRAEVFQRLTDAEKDKIDAYLKAEAEAAEKAAQKEAEAPRRAAEMRQRQAEAKQQAISQRERMQALEKQRRSFNRNSIELPFIETFTNGIDPTVWRIVERPGNRQGKPDAEAHLYVAEAPMTDSKGLHVVARREDRVHPRTRKLFHYTSGRLETRQTFLYGRIEFQAKLPRGKGLCPALWLRTPDNASCDGEIDVIEGFGSHPYIIQSTLHHWAAGKHLGLQCGLIGLDFRKTPFCRNCTTAIGGKASNFSADYHTFAVDWRPDHVSWLLDGRTYFTLTEHVPQIPLSVAIALMVGGIMDGPPTPETPFPAYLDVKLVRITQ